MKLFTLKKVAAGAALLSLFACGEDSSSGSKDQDIFSTKDDRPTRMHRENRRRHALRGKRFRGLLLRRRQMDSRWRHDRNGHLGRFLLVGKETE